jgi:chromosome segregation ATPase
MLGGGTLSTVITLFFTRRATNRKTNAEASKEEAAATDNRVKTAQTIIDMWERTVKYLEQRVATLEQDGIKKDQRVTTLECEVEKLRGERKYHLKTIAEKEAENAELRAALEAKDTEIVNALAAKDTEIAALKKEVAELTERVQILEKKRRAS